MDIVYAIIHRMQPCILREIAPTKYNIHYGKLMIMRTVAIMFCKMLVRVEWRWSSTYLIHINCGQMYDHFLRRL